MFTTISTFTASRLSWGLLFLSALGLEIAALYFQHALDLQPCIMCIYQRTAVFGVLFSALPAALINNIMTRAIGFVGWGVSSIWGLMIAIEHVDIQTAINPFFATCEIVPNFPSWAPLHQWLPNIFGATGDCGDINWSFLDMSMPQWMIVIFAVYALVWVLVLANRALISRTI
ncbi:disulfide bond formation protein DsbB [Paraglaciecola sp. 2405UD69-4]|uniref:disulfide bond formation protein DsbB n=1 Tax=Paraglaciecola sp. 2405UD69-4 TaxID=3391836 RepID=UPI0039C97B70